MTSLPMSQPSGKPTGSWPRTASHSQRAGVRPGIALATPGLPDPGCPLASAPGSGRVDPSESAGASSSGRQLPNGVWWLDPASARHDVLYGGDGSFVLQRARRGGPGLVPSPGEPRFPHGRSVARRHTRSRTLVQPCALRASHRRAWAMPSAAWAFCTSRVRTHSDGHGFCAWLELTLAVRGYAATVTCAGARLARRTDRPQELGLTVASAQPWQQAGGLTPLRLDRAAITDGCIVIDTEAVEVRASCPHPECDADRCRDLHPNPTTPAATLLLSPHTAACQWAGGENCFAPARPLGVWTCTNPGCFLNARKDSCPPRCLQSVQACATDQCGWALDRTLPIEAS